MTEISHSAFERIVETARSHGVLSDETIEVEFAVLLAADRVVKAAERAHDILTHDSSGDADQAAKLTLRDALSGLKAGSTP